MSLCIFKKVKPVFISLTYYHLVLIKVRGILNGSKSFQGLGYSRGCTTGVSILFSIEGYFVNQKNVRESHEIYLYSNVFFLATFAFYGDCM